MNRQEFEMIELLKKLKNEYGVIEIKAEFEAEGSRIEELMRLKDVSSYVNLPIIYVREVIKCTITEANYLDYV